MLLGDDLGRIGVEDASSTRQDSQTSQSSDNNRREAPAVSGQAFQAERVI